jgi:transcriptional regulator with XRE-family HTH domain
MADELADKTTGARIQYFRERAGMSRRALAGLVDRSEQWVKAIEKGRLLPPRLPMLLKIAQALKIDDLAALTGAEQAVPVDIFAGKAHAALASVRAALTDYQIAPTGEPPRLPHLEARLADAWTVRHRSPDHRTQVGALLPGLIRDAQRAARMHTGEDLRAARRLLAGVYHLADMYVAYQPAPELVWMVADRAMLEAREADDPYVMGGSAWALVSAFRETGRWEEALMVALDVARLLERSLASADDDWRALWGALQFEAAYTCARSGRPGEAWRYWDKADAIARSLPAGYWHRQTSFGHPVMRAHAVTVGVELRKVGEAARAADSLDPAEIASTPRRARHLIEVARVHQLQRDRLAMFMYLDKAQRTAPETAAYNGHARSMALALLDHPPVAFRREAADLALRVGVQR